MLSRRPDVSIAIGQKVKLWVLHDSAYFVIFFKRALFAAQPAATDACFLDIDVLEEMGNNGVTSVTSTAIVELLITSIDKSSLILLSSNILWGSIIPLQPADLAN